MARKTDRTIRWTDHRLGRTGPESLRPHLRYPSAWMIAGVLIFSPIVGGIWLVAPHHLRTGGRPFFDHGVVREGIGIADYLEVAVIVSLMGAAFLVVQIASVWLSNTSSLVESQMRRIRCELNPGVLTLHLHYSHSARILASSVRSVVVVRRPHGCGVLMVTHRSYRTEEWSQRRNPSDILDERRPPNTSYGNERLRIIRMDLPETVSAQAIADRLEHPVRERRSGQGDRTVQPRQIATD